MLMLPRRQATLKELRSIAREQMDRLDERAE
jgi:hypothetical protein